MKTIRRLVLCLDGTWNNRDDSTNVLHHFSLTSKGEGSVTQKKFYNPGVGTGPLDRITGGGFGLGLEDHVRDAYNWLVQNYEEASDSQEADEIYIFGFSRGAYEARSLVGFISMCGLLRRGAPLTVSQLWENYCLLGRAREERDSFWRRTFGPEPWAFRAITTLVWDPWLVRPGENPVPEGVPGQRVDDLNNTEKLLVRWSRRVKITYLGVYDTVGAVGWDALAIPGLRSKLALHNNVRPTTLIQSCRHALAIDENRSSFERTPFMAYIGRKTSEDENKRAGIADSAASAGGSYQMRADQWERTLAMWKRKIEQRWFVGAHSNIGGGYPDNRLAQRPLHWLMEGAQKAGLLSEPLPEPLPVAPSEAAPRDSFAEFAAPLWELVLRAKRNYRTIDPHPELRANRDEDKEKDINLVQPGFSLVNIQERIDPSVFAYWKDEKNPPPNLVSYATRALARGVATHHRPEETSAESRRQELESLQGRVLVNPWLEGGFVPHLALVLWATLAAAGLAVTDRLFCFWPSTPPVCFLSVFAAAFALVDWSESRANFSIARGSAQPFVRPFQDAVYWLRAIGVVLFFFGACGAVSHLWWLGWHAPSQVTAWNSSWREIGNWWCVPVGAIAGVLLGNVFNQTFSRRAGPILGACAVALLFVAGIPVIVHLAQAVGHVVLASLHRAPTAIAAPHHHSAAPVAGCLLLLQLGFFYLIRASAWNGEPMRTANLGSVVALQSPWTPAGVKACLDRWCKMLGSHDPQSAECGMCAIVGQSLWRDMFGYIPVYTNILGFGLWFGCMKLGWENWLPVRHLWLIIPITTLVMDYLEDCCHFHYLALHRRHLMPSGTLTVFSRLCTMIKDIGVGVELTGTLLAIALATWEIGVTPAAYGWRGLAALSISTATVAIVGGLGIWCLVYRLIHSSASTPPPAAVAE